MAWAIKDPDGDVVHYDLLQDLTSLTSVEVEAAGTAVTADLYIYPRPADRD